MFYKLILNIYYKMASSSPHVVLRTHDEVYLVGNVNNQIVGSKLPSIKQVLSVLFYNLRHVKLNLRESARLVFKEIVLFWQKARIPVRDEQHCILKLEKLYQNLRELQKSAKRASEKNTKNVNEFKEKLNDLFDVSHSNALNMMKNEEDKNFLLIQRQKGRPGCMLGTDRNLAKKENRALVNLHKSEQRRKRAKIEIEQIGK